MSKTKESFVYQDLSKDNILQFVSTYVDTFNSPPWNDGWSLEVATERLLHFSNFPRFFGLSLWIDGAIVGFALGWSERWIGGWQFHLYEMCIVPSKQGAGYGRALLDQIEQRVKPLGCTAVFLQTSEKLGARRFYEACGYQDRGLMILGKRCAD